MQSLLKISASLIIGLTAALNFGTAVADATLIFDTQLPSGEKQQTTIVLSGRFARVDVGNPDEPGFDFYDNGLYQSNRVNETLEQYTTARLPFDGMIATDERIPVLPAVTPVALKLGTLESKPLIIPSNHKYQVINKACRVVDEMQNSNVVIKHCMANTQSLGLSNREMITGVKPLKTLQLLVVSQRE